MGVQPKLIVLKVHMTFASLTEGLHLVPKGNHLARKEKMFQSLQMHPTLPSETDNAGVRITGDSFLTAYLEKIHS